MISLQSYAKVYVFVLLKENCIELKRRGENFHKSINSVKSSEIFESWMMRAAHIGLFLFSLFTVVCILIVIYPILFYIIFGERILHFGFEILMLDWQNSWLAYALNFVHQALCVIIFVIASIPSLIVPITYVMTSFGYFETLSLLIEDLNEFANGNENGEKNQEIKGMIKFIIEMHLELIE